MAKILIVLTLLVTSAYCATTTDENKGDVVHTREYFEEEDKTRIALTRAGPLITQSDIEEGFVKIEQLRNALGTLKSGEERINFILGELAPNISADKKKYLLDIFTSYYKQFHLIYSQQFINIAMPPVHTIGWSTYHTLMPHSPLAEAYLTTDKKTQYDSGILLGVICVEVAINLASTRLKVEIAEGKIKLVDDCEEDNK